MALHLEPLYVVEETSHELGLVGVANVVSLIPLHGIVDHVVMDGLLPMKKGVHPGMNWQGDTFIDISITIDSMFASSVIVPGC